MSHGHHHQLLAVPRVELHPGEGWTLLLNTCTSPSPLCTLHPAPPPPHLRTGLGKRSLCSHSPVTTSHTDTLLSVEAETSFEPFLDQDRLEGVR